MAQDGTSQEKGWSEATSAPPPPLRAQEQNAPACVSGKGHLHALDHRAPADCPHADSRSDHFWAIRKAHAALRVEAPDVGVPVAAVLAALFQKDGLGGGVHAHMHNELCEHTWRQEIRETEVCSAPQTTQRESSGVQDTSTSQMCQHHPHALPASPDECAGTNNSWIETHVASNLNTSIF